jgi:uncharacterized protein YehS (DUF1456 family)
MINNNILRSVRYILNVNDSKLIQIIGLSGLEVSASDITCYLKNDNDDGFQLCNDEVMSHFLNGLIYYKRGKDDSRPPLRIETPITNNLILKKLRVAFELKDSDIIALIEKSGLSVSKTELSAFFRKPDHRNYRECGDQFLRYLLKGL